MKTLLEQLLGRMGRKAAPALSAKEAVILGLLLEGGEMYGLELVERAGGELKRGTVYVTLGRMEDKGYLASREAKPAVPTAGLPRRLYRPTALGKQALRAWQHVALALASARGAR